MRSPAALLAALILASLVPAPARAEDPRAAAGSNATPEKPGADAPPTASATKDPADVRPAAKPRADADLAFDERLVLDTGRRTPMLPMLT